VNRNDPLVTDRGRLHLDKRWSWASHHARHEFRTGDPVVREHPELFLPADSSDGEILEARRTRCEARA
jgi:hypothetical protein